AGSHSSTACTLRLTGIIRWFGGQSIAGDAAVARTTGGEVSATVTVVDAVPGETIPFEAETAMLCSPSVNSAVSPNCDVVRTPPDGMLLVWAGTPSTVQTTWIGCPLESWISA